MTWITSEATNSWVAQDRGNKSAHIRSAMTTLAKVRMLYLVNTMSIHWQKELNVVEGSKCNYFRPMWKPTSCAMVTKASWIGSVLMRSLLWAQHKKWIPIRLMGSMHTHWRMLAIEKWGNPSHVQSVLQKIREDNRKVGKTSWVVSQKFALGIKHDKFWAQWTLNVLLEKVWWCKCFKMESWSWTICCPMSCSNGRKHAHATSGKRSHATLRCCWKK